MQTIIVFLLVSLAWIFFRSPNLSVAKTVLGKIFSPSIWGRFDYSVAGKPVLLFSFLLILFLLIKERYMLVIPTGNTWLFCILFSSILAACYLFGVFNNVQFIYFQF